MTKTYSLEFTTTQHYDIRGVIFLAARGVHHSINRLIYGFGTAVPSYWSDRPSKMWHGGTHIPTPSCGSYTIMIAIAVVQLDK